MRNKLSITAGALIAATAGITAGLLTEKMAKQRKTSMVSDTENESSSESKLFTEEFTKEKVTGYIEKLFRLFNPMDLRDLFEDYDIPQDRLVPFYAKRTADAVYEGLKDSFKIIPSVQDTDEQGRNIVDMECELFQGPAACIYREYEEICFDQSDIYNNHELWMVAEDDGLFAIVRCIERDYKGSKTIYRFIERYVQFEEDVICGVDVLFRSLLESYESRTKDVITSC